MRGNRGCRSERGSARFLLFGAPFHRADRPHGLGGLRFALLLGGFGVPAVEFEDVLAGERLLVPVEELRRRIGLVVMLAVWEDRELVEVFGEPWRGLGDVDKAILDHRKARSDSTKAHKATFGEPPT